MTAPPMMKRYDLSIRKLIETITSMNVEERGLLLKEMESFTEKIKLRATRKKCSLPVKFINSRGSYSAVVKNISFTGAFVLCRVPMLIDEKIFMYFELEDSAEKFKLSAKVVHSKPQGFGVQFGDLDSRAARFLQACMDRM